MKLVVDTNRITAALIKDGLARAILTSAGLEFCTIMYVRQEVLKYLSYIMQKSNLPEGTVIELLDLVLQNVRIIPENIIRQQMPEAQMIMADIDPADAPIIACALAIPNNGIWTEDKHFDRQDKVKVWKTGEVLQYLQRRTDEKTENEAA